jgi:hypothetical protein
MEEGHHIPEVEVDHHDLGCSTIELDPDHRILGNALPTISTGHKSQVSCGLWDRFETLWAGHPTYRYRHVDLVCPCHHRPGTLSSSS